MQVLLQLVEIAAEPPLTVAQHEVACVEVDEPVRAEGQRLWVASARLLQSEALAIGHPPQPVLPDLIVSGHCPPPIASYARKCSQRYSRSHGKLVLYHEVRLLECRFAPTER